MSNLVVSSSLREVTTVVCVHNKAFNPICGYNKWAKGSTSCEQSSRIIFVIDGKSQLLFAPINKLLIRYVVTTSGPKVVFLDFLFGSNVKLKRASDFKIKYNGQEICPQNCINYLGVTIDRTLSGNNMVDSVVKIL